MPVVPTYPGVYIDEMPATARTIAGVRTAVAAFVGFTKQGPVNQAVELYNFGDYVRRFGDLDSDSEISYAVQQFFQNGGADAIVVRCASGAVAASITLTSAGGAQAVLKLSATSEGDWGNSLRVLVDYATSNPSRYFNLLVQQVQNQGGQQQVVVSEQHRNLSMNSRASSYAVDVLNANSQLLKAERPVGALALLTAGAVGASTSGDLSAFNPADITPQRCCFMVTVNGSGPFLADLSTTGVAITDLDTLATAMQTAIRALAPADPVFQGVTVVSDNANHRVTIASTFGAAGSTDKERSSLLAGDASTRNAASLLRLGTGQGGTETEAAAAMRPLPSGTVSSVPTLAGLPGSAAADITLTPATGAAQTLSGVSLWSGTAPTTVSELAGRLSAALNARTEAALQRSSVTAVNGELQIVAGGPDPGVRIGFANAGGDTTATDIGLAGSTPNVARYALGIGATVGAQSGAVPGSGGTVPTDNDLIGNRADKTGLYALLDTDLFTILSLPRGGSDAVLASAIALAEERRALFVMDMPSTVNTPDKAEQWLNAHGLARSKNVSVYFPRVMVADSQQDFRTRAFPNSGVLAGLYARTDAERGVWKAPAGIEAVLKGVSSLEYKLTDGENGTLNPLGLNALRTFPVIGNVSWGARTMRGADTLADQWKYVSVRRLALYLEESLFRGTQWVVFEPNDEPLWGQIRLSIGAFLNGLFRQGAFQGTTPAQAYFVKCDSETTTQADRNNGIVNIVVGFAPLKPAEFVILQIQQIASQDS